MKNHLASTPNVPALDDDAHPAPAPARLAVGLVGVGKLGAVIGRLAAEAGHELLVAERPGNPMFELVVGSILPSARTVPLAELLARADVVVLAVPQPALAGLDLSGVRGDVVDATNAWDAVPAEDEGVDADWWARRLPGTPVVKTLNHAAYAELLTDARPAGAPGRRAVAVAGSDADAVDRVVAFVDSLGFDAVPAPAEAASLLEPGAPVFGGRFDAAGMREALAGAPVD